MFAIINYIMEAKSNTKLNQILNLIDKNFYKSVYNLDMLKTYLGVIIKEVLRINHLKTSIKFKTIEHEHIYGIYSEKKKTIYLNKKYFILFDYFKKTNNIFYIYKIVDTLIHELRHMLQGKDIENIHPLIKSYAKYYHLAPASYEQYKKSYKANILEVDARYYAYQIFKHNENLSKFVNSAWFIKNEIIGQRRYNFSLIDFLQTGESQDKLLNSFKSNLTENYNNVLKQKKLSYKQCLSLKTQLCSNDYYAKTNENQLLYETIAPLFNEKILLKQLDRTYEEEINSQIQAFLNAFRDPEKYIESEGENYAEIR